MIFRMILTWFRVNIVLTSLFFKEVGPNLIFIKYDFKFFS